MSHSTRFHMLSTVFYHLERHRPSCVFYRRILQRSHVLGAFCWSSMLQTPTSERPLFSQLNLVHALSRFTGSRFARMHSRTVPERLYPGPKFEWSGIVGLQLTRLSLETVFIVPERHYRTAPCSFANTVCGTLRSFRNSMGLGTWLSPCQKSAVDLDCPGPQVGFLLLPEGLSAS